MGEIVDLHQPTNRRCSTFMGGKVSDTTKHGARLLLAAAARARPGAQLGNGGGGGGGIVPGRSVSTRAPPSAAAMAAKEPPHVVEDCRGVLQVLSDGTVVRSAAPPYAVEDRDDGRVEWRDAVYDAARSLGVRMYRPSRGRDGEQKLPVLTYFHGGGFCIGSYAWPNTHAGCLRLADEVPAVVLSFGYRLAPEHRLPAAHEDAATALLWLRDRLVVSGGADDDDNDGVDAWLADSGADPVRVFVSGNSAGGNMAHHMAVRFGTAGLSPVKIAGYVLIIPAFISEEPTESELATAATANLNKDIADRYNRLALPAGANKDHPLMNPLGPHSPSLEGVDVGRMLVVVGGRDMLRDNQIRYAERMKAVAKDADAVELVVLPGQQHGFFSRNPWSEASGELVAAVRRFMERGGARHHISGRFSLY